MKVEHAIVQFLNSWIVVVLPLSVAAIRLLLFKFAGELKEVYRNLFSIPQDLVFIAISFILAGLSRTIPAFAAHYSSDREADLMGILHIIGLLALAWFLGASNRFVNSLQENFRISWQQIKRWQKNHPEQSLTKAPQEIGSKFIWALLYIILISIIVAVELLVSCMAVGESLQHIQP